MKHHFLDFHVGFWDGSVGETKSASKRFLLLPGVSFIAISVVMNLTPKNNFSFIIMNFEIVTFSSKLQVIQFDGFVLSKSRMVKVWQLQIDYDGNLEMAINIVPVLSGFFWGEISSFEQNTCLLWCNPSTQKFESAIDSFRQPAAF